MCHFAPRPLRAGVSPYINPLSELPLFSLRSVMMGLASAAVICRELGAQLRSHFVLPARVDFLVCRSRGGVQIWLTADFPRRNVAWSEIPPWPPMTTSAWLKFFVAFDDLGFAADGSVAFSESWLGRFEEFYGFPVATTGKRTNSMPWGTGAPCLKCGTLHERWEMWKCPRCGRRLCEACSMVSPDSWESLCAVCRGETSARKAV